MLKTMNQQHKWWTSCKKENGPFWIDLCIQHYRCARVLTGTVEHRPCVPGVDCKSNFQHVNFYSNDFDTLTWADVIQKRYADLQHLRASNTSRTSGERYLSDAL